MLLPVARVPDPFPRVNNNEKPCATVPSLSAGLTLLPLFGFADCPLKPACLIHFGTIFFPSVYYGFGVPGPDEVGYERSFFLRQAREVRINGILPK
jgi:hypothetical protein